MHSRDFCAKKKQSRGNRKRDKVVIDVSNTNYPVISKAALSLNWKPFSDDYNQNDYDVLWTDSGLGIERHVRTMKSYQKINHFPGMVKIYRKDYLAKCMEMMQSVSNEYNFVPKTWKLPKDYKEIIRYLRSKKGKCVIVKPANGAQGRGIHLAMSTNYIPQNPREKYIVQSYLKNPLLIDGFKFDLRIYVLVTCCNPLRILIFKEGLCRLCTTPYNPPNQENVECSYMHLTNYAVNKYNTSYVENTGDDENTSSKRSLAWLWEWLEKRGAEKKRVWRAISDVVVKTLISTQASLSMTFKDTKISGLNKNPFTCFELLGFDIILTEKLKPYLIEVNHTPSFRTDSQLDLRIKLNLIQNTLKLLNVSVDDRRRHAAETARASQIRLCGNPYQSFKVKTPSGQWVEPCESNERYWRSYEANEEMNIGDYELIYPTNVYQNQPTAGLQSLYDHLLSKGEETFFATLYREPVWADDSAAPVEVGVRNRPGGIVFNSDEEEEEEEVDRSSSSSSDSGEFPFLTMVKKEAKDSSPVLISNLDEDKEKEIEPLLMKLKSVDLKIKENTAQISSDRKLPNSIQTDYDARMSEPDTFESPKAPTSPKPEKSNPRTTRTRLTLSPLHVRANLNEEGQEIKIAEEMKVSSNNVTQLVSPWDSLYTFRSPQYNQSNVDHNTKFSPAVTQTKSFFPSTIQDTTSQFCKPLLQSPVNNTDLIKIDFPPQEEDDKDDDDNDDDVDSVQTEMSGGSSESELPLLDLLPQSMTDGLTTFGMERPNSKPLTLAFPQEVRKFEVRDSKLVNYNYTGFDKNPVHGLNSDEVEVKSGNTLFPEIDSNIHQRYKSYQANYLHNYKGFVSKKL